MSVEAGGRLESLWGRKGAGPWDFRRRVSPDKGPPPVLGTRVGGWGRPHGLRVALVASRSEAGLVVCVQGVKERAYASSGEAITSLPVSIPLSTVQPSKLPVSIPLASVVLPSRAEKVVSARRPGALLSPGDWPGPLGSAVCCVGEEGVSAGFFPVDWPADEWGAYRDPRDSPRMQYRFPFSSPDFFVEGGMSGWRRN